MLGNILSVSLSTSAVIALVAAVQSLFGKKYSVKWRYYAWLIITLRLLLPFDFSIPEAPVNIGVLYDTQNSAQALPDYTVKTALPQTKENFAPQNADIAAVDTVKIPKELQSQKSFMLPDLRTVCTIIWFSGVMLYLLYNAVCYMIFRRRIKPLKYIDKSSRPYVAVCENINSPMLAGYKNPTILLPDTEYAEEELSFILAHENVHFRRKDLWYKLMLICACAIHWFNPFVHIMAHMANRDMELSCDEKVVSGRDISFRKKYSSAILNTARPEKAGAFSTYFKGGKKDMKKRFENILSTGIKHKGIAALIFTLAVITAAGIFVACGNGYTYKNAQLGFSLELPSSWKEDCEIVENGSSVMFYNSANHKYDGGGLLFYIERMDGTLSNEQINEPGGRIVAAHANGYTYVAGTPTDVQYDVQNKKLSESYMSMYDQAEGIYTKIKTFEPDGGMPNSVVTRLYANKNTYTGDNSAVSSIVAQTEFTTLPVSSISLKTDSEPYGITVNYKVESRSGYRYMNTAGFRQTAAIMFALIPNAGEIRFAVYDDYSDLSNPDTAFYSSYYARNDMAQYGDFLTTQNIENAASSSESFAEYYNLVKNMEDDYSNTNAAGKNARLNEIYRIIGDDSEIVTNSLITADISVDDSAAAKLDELFSDFTQSKNYIGKTLRVEGAAVRNFKTGAMSYAAFLFDGTNLLSHVSYSKENAQMKAIEWFINNANL